MSIRNVSEVLLRGGLSSQIALDNATDLGGNHLGGKKGKKRSMEDSYSPFVY
jgi:hypothetical protein